MDGMPRFVACLAAVPALADFTATTVAPAAPTPAPAPVPAQ